MVRQGPDGFRVVTVSGPAVRVNQYRTGPRALALQLANTRLPTSTTIIGSGDRRSLGFAIRATGIPGITGKLFLYRETSLGRLSAYPAEPARS